MCTTENQKFFLKLVTRTPSKKQKSAVEPTRKPAAPNILVQHSRRTQSHDDSVTSSRPRESRADDLGGATAGHGEFQWGQTD